MAQSQYPDIAAGRRITGNLLRQMIWTRKEKETSDPPRVNATLAPDPELSAITLGIGKYEVESIIFALHEASGTTTTNISLKWGFTGSATCVRAALSIAASSANTTAASMRNIGSAIGTVQTYGVTGTFFHPIREEFTLTVTAGGDLSVDWAQGTTNAANAIRVGVGSFVRWRQIA